MLTRPSIISKRSAGALTLTLASIILLSGLWCYFLSPTTSYTKHEPLITVNPSIEPGSYWFYALNLEEGESIHGSVTLRGIKPYERVAFTVRIRNPGGELAWSDVGTTYSSFTIKATERGKYRLEVHNPTTTNLPVHVYVGKRVETSFKPLKPLGQWLAIISIPIFALGLWASELKIRKA